MICLLVETGATTDFPAYATWLDKPNKRLL